MMEVTKVVTSVFVLCLSGPTFGYPFTRSNIFSDSGMPAGAADRAQGHGGSNQLPGHLEDYLANYVQQHQASQQYPQYQQQQQQQPAYYQQGPYQQTQLTAETLAALLPYLSSSRLSALSGGLEDAGSAGSSADYAYPDYPSGGQSYTDDEGTWYDEMANAYQPRTQQDEEQAAVQLLLNHLNGRYSLDDLEAMEREAEMEENTESQLQSLMNQKVRRHETMNDFGQGDDEHLTIRRLRESVGTVVKRSGQGEKERVGHEEHEDDDDIEKELKEQDSDDRDNTQANSQDHSASGVVIKDEKSSTHSTGLRKRSWGQTIGHLSFWGPDRYDRYRSHRLHRGDIGHIKFMSPY